jgi:hypothetical protein
MWRRIKDGLHWRWSQVREAIVQRWTTAAVAWRWHIRRGMGRSHHLSAKLIVSLTSYPPRFGTLALTLRGLLRQTVKADHTILWIADADIPLLPKEVSDLQKAGLEIRPTADIKSYKKIIPALEAFPEAFICTADDDLYYWPTWLEELIEGASTTDRVVTCHCAHEITADAQGNFRPYREWIFDVPGRGKLDHLFPTGAGGVLYPPGVLTHNAEDKEAALSLCPHGDDIWLYWMGRRNGASYRTVGRPQREFISWRGSQEQALWYQNILRGDNDEQLRKIAEKYGYPK